MHLDQLQKEKKIKIESKYSASIKYEPNTRFADLKVFQTFEEI